MVPGNSKTVVNLLGTGVTAGATVTANIDTLGADFCSIDLVLGTSNTVSNKPSTLKLSESDDTVVTNFADITKFVGGGAGGFTIPNADTSNPNVYRFNVDCRARKRYLRLTATPLTTQQAVMVARLGRLDESPSSATETGTGVLALVEG